METNLLTRYLEYQIYHAGVIFHSLCYEGKEEQIHNFRIALRHIRSMIKLFPEDLPPFPNSLKSVMKATNPIRELDVLLHSLSGEAYPKLFKQITKLRRRSFKHLFTPEFITHALSHLEEYGILLRQYGPHIIPEIIIQRVLRQYQHALETDRSLNINSKSKTLHRLRIDYKDARYGFEFLEVSNLHPCRDLVLQCKKRQSQLGIFQDATNQIQWLKELAHKLPTSEVSVVLRKRKKSLKQIKDTIALGQHPLT